MQSTLLFLMKLLLFVFIASSLLQNYLIFFPVRLIAPPGLPKIPGRTFVHVSFSADDGTVLTGVWMGTSSPASELNAGPASRPVLLFSHGNAGHLGYRLARLEAFANLPVDVFLYDYRGFGRSDGRPSVSGVKKDAQAALAYLLNERKIPIERVILYGESIGGGVATWLAGDHLADIGGVVVESGFRSLKFRAASRFPIIGPLVLSDDLPSETILAKYTGPLLVIHSRDDRIIPFEDGKTLFDVCPSKKKRLCELTGAGHNDPVWARQDYMTVWRDFLAETFPEAR
ncbi:MAG TPA: alpha/beta fold hydrolase [Candidatus Ozemobacteraceae bacterium]|nr:alpha/beta fold hydrolase [Candidatus Ozemobacteraceae bacterium]HQG28702.1 alpha/beta fold hydrolase [Candidatus Ozemobacteraceae bacterium]